jgi:L-rhamnose-H+ transport protein
MADLAIKYGAKDIWSGLPKLIVVLLGGFTSNFIWCALLNAKNGTGYQYLVSKVRGPLPGSEEAILENAIDGPGEETLRRAPQRSAVAVAVPQTVYAPMLNNYFFSALAGVTWYMQFFFYTMGESQMGKYKFSSWTLHMSSIIIFSSLWGIALKEWKGSSWRTKIMLAIALATLIESTIIIGFGNSLKG